MDLIGGYSDDEEDDCSNHIEHFNSTVEIESSHANNPVSDESNDDVETHHAPYKSESLDEDKTEINLDSFASINKIPISHQVDLGGHEKAVVCFSIEPSGNRVATGSLDYNVKLFDFGGMDSRHRSFRSIEPESGHPVTCISHSPNGDRFVVSTACSQCVVYDREGTEVIKFAKGDMYIRDLTHTKGHTMEVTGVQWHPSDKNTVLTSGLDGSLRVWDLLGEAHFGHLINKHVLKVRAATGQGRLGATACCYSPNGMKVIGGAADGTIHIWNVKKQINRADIIIKPAHQGPISCVNVSADNSTLVSRGCEDCTVLVWDLNKPSKPVVSFEGAPNDYPTANVDFSPDGKYLCCGTTPRTRAPQQSAGSRVATSSSSGRNNNSSSGIFQNGNEISEAVVSVSEDRVSAGNVDNTEVDVSDSQSSMLYFFEIATSMKIYRKVQLHQLKKIQLGQGNSGKAFETITGSPSLKIAVKKYVSAIMVKWQAKTNQIFCSTSDGYVRVFFDPRVSVKGALLTSGRPARREADQSDAVVIGEIINPNALPMYRNDTLLTKKKDAKEQMKAKAPSKPLDMGPNRGNTSFFFTQYVMQNRAQDNSRSEDPREALLKLDKLAKEDPIYFGNAYSTSQPKMKLADMTFEQEQEEFKKKQKTVL